MAGRSHTGADRCNDKRREKMRPQKKRAARLAPEAARDTAQHNSDHTPATSKAQEAGTRASIGRGASLQREAEVIDASPAPDAVGTDTTDESYSVGNDDFLRAVFGDEFGDARPMVVSFDGDPASASPKCWFGNPWEAKSEAFTSRRPAQTTTSVSRHSNPTMQAGTGGRRHAFKPYMRSCWMTWARR